MADFDPSVLERIGATRIDPAQAQAKALTLSDLYRQEDVGKMAVTAQKQGAADMTYAKEVLSKSDLSTLEGQNKAVSEITKRSPELGMKLMRDFQSGRQAKTEADKSQLELYDKKNDIIGGAVVGLKTQHDDLIRSGKNEAEVNAAMMPQVMQTVQGLVNAKLPDGSPVLSDQDRQWIGQNLAKGYNPQAIDQLVQKSQQAKAAIAAKLNERKVDVAERRADANDKNVASLVTDRTAKREMGRFDQEDVEFMAAQYLAGDKSVFANLGRGAQGPENIVRLRREIRAQAEEAGSSPAEVTAKIAEFNGVMAEQRSLGTRLANIRTAATEAAKMIPIAKEANAAVPRGTFKPWNQLVRGTDIIVQDPEYAKFAAATLAVVNTWARAISPSGTPTVADKEHADKVLSTAQSQEAYDAVLDQFATEVQAALESPTEVQSEIRKEIKASALGTRNESDQNRKSPPAAEPGSETPPPASGTAAGGGPAPPPGFKITG
jgi:hypothetical protein